MNNFFPLHEIKLDDCTGEDMHLLYGELYFVFSSMNMLHKKLFKPTINGERIAFINAPFAEAIKISDVPGNKQNPYYSILEKIRALVDRVLPTSDILISEMVGLSPLSLADITKYCYEKVKLNKNKIIVLWQPNLV